MNRTIGIIVLGLLLGFAASAAGAAEHPEGKKLGSVFNNDINNILYAVASDGNTAVADYRRAVDALLDLKPGVLAQNVGLPDAVIYRSEVATPFHKYLSEVSKEVWPEQPESGQTAVFQQLVDAGTDPLAITIEACRARGVPILASYRMNAEDWYGKTWRLTDFGRAHPEYRLGGAGCLDPNVPAVYEHRMRIFREVAERYDIDGIELDFRRWYRMISNPHENHVVLTRMVREVRRMLDEVAKRKGRSKLLLGVRVGPSLDSEPSIFLYPGSLYPTNPQNASCKDLGLDVKTWIAEGNVDYVCPSLFLATLPGLPLTKEFVDLAKGTDVGVYPTVFSQSAWMHEVLKNEHPVGLKDDDAALAQFKYDLCMTVLKAYGDGADGISTYNWYSHLRDAKVPNLWTKDICGAGAEAVLSYICPLLGDPKAVRAYLDEPWALPPKE